MIHDHNNCFEQSDAWFVDGDSISVVMTLGEEPDRVIAALFESGRYTEAVMMDQKMVQALFDLERQVRKEITLWCCQHGKHIQKCLTDPDDLPITLMRKVVQTAQNEHYIGVSVNDSGILLPGKSLCEVFLLDNGIAEVQKSPCSVCERLDCSYRCRKRDVEN